MKGILIILDGISDLPCRQLGGKTPLEAAKTPNLDFFASHGHLGYMYPISEKIIPDSDNAVISIFGNNFSLSSRGQFEAIGAGFKLQRGDLALRTNFNTINNLTEGKVIDRRAGRTLTTKEAIILGKAIKKQMKLPIKFIFQPTVQHRGVLIFRGGFSDNITNTDSHYLNAKNRVTSKFKFAQPLDEDDNTQYTCNILNEFIAQSYKILNNHPINIERRKKGLLPANIILTRGAGAETPKLKQMKNWCSVSYMPLEKGIAKVAGMSVFSFNYPKLKKYDVYKTLYDGLNTAIKFSLKIMKKKFKKFDYAYLHFKETDLPGHDNKPHDKVKMIEILDERFFSKLKVYAIKNKVRIAVTGDHSTPCKLKKHSADPVPVLLFNPFGFKKEQRFTEKDCKKGKLGKIIGKDFLKKIGFDK